MRSSSLGKGQDFQGKPTLPVEADWKRLFSSQPESGRAQVENVAGTEIQRGNAGS